MDDDARRVTGGEGSWFMFVEIALLATLKSRFADEFEVK